jgi:hypothetical protein
MKPAEVARSCRAEVRNPLLSLPAVSGAALEHRSVAIEEGVE